MEGAQRGDGDPLDINVVSERPIERVEVILNARVVGGLPMLDGGEADDKIIAVLENDPIWSHVEVLEDLPSALIDRLRHYFETYKVLPDQPADVSIGEAYGREHAEKVVLAAMSDYEAAFGNE
jgi:inorganic pyrophosphatase